MFPECELSRDFLGYAQALVGESVRHQHSTLTSDKPGMITFVIIVQMHRNSTTDEKVLTKLGG